MFSGQDTGNLTRQFDILKSKEQQLEGKVTELEKKNLYEQIIGKMSIIDSNSNILDKNYTEKEYNRLSKQLKEKRLKCQLKHAVHLLEIRWVLSKIL